jgi:short-subunit dehydrogenase
VVLAGRNLARLSEAGQEATSAGATTVSEVIFDGLDVTNVGDVVDRCFAAASGDVDLVIMALGVLGDQAHDEVDAAGTVSALTATTVWPSAALAAAFARMQKQGHGQIVVLSSVAGVRVRRANYVYGAAKAGLDAYAVGLSEAARGTGVTVHIVRPGFVHTKMTEGMTPAPFSTDTGTVADSVVSGLEKGHTIIWAPTPLRFVFTVFRVLPQFVWRRLPG